MRSVFLLAVVVALTGCGLFRSQVVPLEKAEVATLQEKHGPLTAENRVEWATSAGEILDEEVTAVELRKDGVHVAVLGSPAGAMGKDALNAVVTGVTNNPGKTGIGIALTAGLVAMLQRFRKRRALNVRGFVAQAGRARPPPLEPSPA